jgi:hypothetical protein
MAENQMHIGAGRQIEARAAPYQRLAAQLDQQLVAFPHAAGQARRQQHDRDIQRRGLLRRCLAAFLVHARPSLGQA